VEEQGIGMVSTSHSSYCALSTLQDTNTKSMCVETVTVHVVYKQGHGACIELI
jgi:hypothetical protein